MGQIPSALVKMGSNWAKMVKMGQILIKWDPKSIQISFPNYHLIIQCHHLGWNLRDHDYLSRSLKKCTKSPKNGPFQHKNSPKWLKMIKIWKIWAIFVILDDFCSGNICIWTICGVNCSYTRTTRPTRVRMLMV